MEFDESVLRKSGNSLECALQGQERFPETLGADKAECECGLEGLDGFASFRTCEIAGKSEIAFRGITPTVFGYGSACLF